MLINLQISGQRTPDDPPVPRTVAEMTSASCARSNT